MKRVRIKEIDVFTSMPFAGSPAHVLTEADKLGDDEMGKIASESGVGTAFVQKATQDGSQFALRFFAPKGEIDFAGNLTIAAFHALAEEAKFFVSEPVTKISQETKSGNLSVEIHSLRSEIQKITIELPKPEMLAQVDREEVAKTLQIDPELLEEASPQVVNVGSAHLIVPVKKRKTLEEAKPDLFSLAELNQAHGAISTHVFALDAISPIAMVHSRNFAPAIGITEMAASGAATGAMAAYLIANELIRGNSPINFIAEQGYVMNRPSEIMVEIHFKRTAVELVKISGQAVTIMEGEVYL